VPGDPPIRNFALINAGFVLSPAAQIMRDLAMAEGI
jgi:hypothetical protein